MNLFESRLKELIYNEVLEDISYLLEWKDVYANIVENLGISADVSNETFKAMEFFKNHFKNSNPSLQIFFDNHDGFKIKRLVTKMKIFNTDITVEFNGYYFADKISWEKYHNSVRPMNGFSFNSKKLVVSVQIKGGNYDRSELMDSIQHELEHFYQENKVGYSFSDDEIYRYVVSNKHTDNQYINVISNVFYLSRKFEQEAYANGLYAMLVSDYGYYGEHINYKETYRQSEIHGAIDSLTQNIKFIQYNKNNSDFLATIKNYHNKINLTYDKLLLMAQQSKKYLIYRAGRTITKFLTDNKLDIPYTIPSYKTNEAYEIRK